MLARALWGPTSYETPFSYPGEFRFNLLEYTVVLDKPLGISIAPDPITGKVCRGEHIPSLRASHASHHATDTWCSPVAQIVVQEIESGSPAEASKLIQVSS